MLASVCRADGGVVLLEDALWRAASFFRVSGDAAGEGDLVRELDEDAVLRDLIEGRVVEGKEPFEEDCIRGGR